MSYYSVQLIWKYMNIQAIVITIKTSLLFIHEQTPLVHIEYNLKKI